MALSVGTRLGTYEIVAPLGAGGMGEVYRAKDLRLGRDVALKVLPESVAKDADRLARFEREARTVAGLNHPNIVTLFSVEDEDGTRFLTMELVEGQSLDKHVAPGGLPVARVVDLGIALSDALTAAHEKGVVHRDLKPANVMLTREGRVKVLDFGLAKLANADSPLGATVAPTMPAVTPLSGDGQVMGTVPYMAPEQVRGEPTDSRTDVFALGILLYELASGRRPFGGATSADVSSAILRDAPAPISKLRTDLPSDLERIVGRCLEKNARERFQTALDVCNELRSLKQALERKAIGTPAPQASDCVASIAVLPFVNRSASAEDEYFSDGLADELLNVLAKIRGLRVAARASSFKFKGSQEDVATIGQKLNVVTLLDGSVRKAGNRVRISVQLVKVDGGYHLWSETYDRTLDDIFAVQDEIAQSVVKELRAALLGENADSKASGEVKADVAQAAKGRGTNPEAHRLYLQARHLIARWNAEDMKKGIAFLEEALKLDPEFALAWAELGGAYANEANQGWAPMTEGHELGREAVQRALSLEPELSEAHTALGRIQLFHDWDFRAAQASFARALELAPGNLLAIRSSGMLAHVQGRIGEATELFRRAIEQDPVNANAYSNYAWTMRAAGRFAEAEAAYRRSLEFAPDTATLHFNLSKLLVDQGRAEEGLAEAFAEPDRALSLCAQSHAHFVLGHRAESDAALRELIQIAPEGSWDFQIAELYAQRGDADAAFEWLERAYERRDSGMAQMRASLGLNPLHGDPRWRVLVEKMGLGD